MTLIDVIPNLARKTSREYCGPCPFCREGTDRFIVFLENDRYWCRHCGESGDAVQYFRKTKGLTFQEACRALDIEPKPDYIRKRSPEGFKGRQTVSPSDLWQQQAKAFVKKASGCLLGKRGAEGKALLSDRGFTRETINHAGLGWNPVDIFLGRQSWGLQSEMNPKTGKPKKLWIPRGLVIPLRDKNKIERIRVRRFQSDDWGRYILIPGSDTKVMCLKGKNPDRWLVVESELDAILVYQEAGDLVSIMALGNAQIRPDTEAHKLLKESDLVLVALDSDSAGAREAWGFWRKTYPKARRWPCIRGKDPSDMHKVGVPVRVWVEAGMIQKGARND